MQPPIHLFREVDSTNDLALAGARDGAAHGATWVADQQLAGRGRREPGGPRRTWHSPRGSNVYMSVVVRPDLQPQDASKITVAAGLSVAAALREATGVDIWLKWPNDLLIGDLKLAGILTEGVFDGGSFAAAVVGIGLNINVAADDVPEELASVMTSLRIEGGRTFDRMALAFAVRDAIVDAADRLEADGLLSFESMAAQLDRCGGRKVEVLMDGNGATGVARGIDLESGGLVVEVAGREQVVLTGEARLLRTATAGE